jgi:hypothetical protein
VEAGRLAGSASTDIEITFEPEGDRTRVWLEHIGFERVGPEAEGFREGHALGWKEVLGWFAERTVAEGDDAGPLHRDRDSSRGSRARVPRLHAPGGEGNRRRRKGDWSTKPGELIRLVEAQKGQRDE